MEVKDLKVGDRVIRTTSGGKQKEAIIEAIQVVIREPDSFGGRLFYGVWPGDLEVDKKEIKVTLYPAYFICPNCSGKNELLCNPDLIALSGRRCQACNQKVVY